MNKGDVVKVKYTGQTGVLVKRSYLAYEQKYSVWTVLLSTGTKRIRQSQLTKNLDFY